ncbi:GDSL esterase/lipase At5g55050 [Linum perenne]
MENLKVLVLFLVCIGGFAINTAYGTASPPVLFILGDSTVDVGTNNFLPESTSRADFPHNGIDFSHSRPTGRFSNGLNSADQLALMMGHKRSPQPFFLLKKKPRGFTKSKFRGVSFASGGSGIFHQTGQTPSNVSSGLRKNVVPLSEQTQQLSFVYNKILSVRKLKGTRDLFSKSLFFISIGSNDLFEHYHSKSKQPTDKFIASLVQAYGNHLRNLLKLGARKFGIVTVAPIGCCPSQRVFNHTLGCLEELNDLALAFHSQVTQLMYNLSFEYRDMKYSIGNAFLMTINVINNPNLGGFKDVTGACCGQGVLLNAQGPCTPTANLCPKRDDFLFWDSYHPTQKAAKLAAVTLYSGPPQFVAPINFKQLAEA